MSIENIVTANDYSLFINSTHRVKSSIPIEDRTPFGAVLVRSEKAAVLVATPYGSAVVIRVDNYCGKTLGDVEELCKDLSLVEGINDVYLNGKHFMNPNPIDSTMNSFVGRMEDAGISHLECLKRFGIAHV